VSRVTICGYTIAADASNWTLYGHRKKGEDAKNPGEPVEFVLGYFSRLPHALDALLDQRLRDADARSLKELVSVIDTTRAEIAEAFSLGSAVKDPTPSTPNLDDDEQG
jgi:hypothetical protein